MGRRAKSGEQSRSNATIRNKTLSNLVYLNDLIMDEKNIYDEKLPFHKELLGRAEVGVKEENAGRVKEGYYQPIFKDSYARPSDLIITYLNADDVMKVLNCNRRTAFDYLVALRKIHAWHTFVGGSTSICAGVV